jgi:hypothetical protein
MVCQELFRVPVDACDFHAVQAFSAFASTIPPLRPTGRTGLRDPPNSMIGLPCQSPARAPRPARLMRCPAEPRPGGVEWIEFVLR